MKQHQIFMLVATLESFSFLSFLSVSLHHPHIIFWFMTHCQVYSAHIMICAEVNNEMSLQAYKLKTLSVHNNAVEAPCEYFGECGGCKTQNLSYEAQLEAKEQQVHDLIARMGKFGKSPPAGESGSYMMPIVPCPTPYGYRNKVCCGTSSCFHFIHKFYNSTSSTNRKS
jgi:hypothetical protein